MSEDNFDLFKELEYIKYKDLSKIGKNVHVLFSNISIDGFLHRNKNKFNPNLLDKKEKNGKITSSIFSGNKENEDNPQKINIENIRNWNKKYKIKSNFLNFLLKENNKSPPCAFYNPNYNSISKHIPIIKLKPINYKPKLNIIYKKSLKRNLSSPKILSKFNSLELEKTIEKEQTERLNISNINNEIKIPNKKLKKILNHSNDNIHAISFNKYSERKDLFIKKYIDYTILEPKLIEKKVQSPNFKKMSSRDKNNEFNKKIEGCVDYNPNYNAIYINGNQLVQNEENKELKRKQYLLKKLWSSFKTSSEYLIVPALNNNE